MRKKAEGRKKGSAKTVGRTGRTALRGKTTTSRAGKKAGASRAKPAPKKKGGV